MMVNDLAPERLVTVFFPDWPVLAAGCAADEPAAVVFANRIVARTASAADAGVVVGQRRRQAQQRCPDVRLLDADPARDAREFEAVLRAIGALTPRLDIVEPGWLSFAARGPMRYFGGQAAFLERLSAAVAEVRGGADHEFGVGIADGRFPAAISARLAVRRGAPVIVPPGESAAFCAELPVGWLSVLGECDAELVDVFVRLGLRRLQHVAALDERDVLGRFGPVGAHVRRLAMGADERPPGAVDPAPSLTVERTIDTPVAESEAVVFVAKQLADRLAQRLADGGQVCTRLVVTLETEHGERCERSWFRSAGMSAAAMVERVRWQLDGWINLPAGSAQEITSGVALIRLVPDEVRRNHGEQLGLWGGQSDADRRAIRTLARLSTIAGERAVTVPVWQGGRLPGDRYRWVPAATADLDARSAAATGAGALSVEPWPGGLPSPSPATVFPEQLPVDVLGADGRRISVSGRGALSAEPVWLLTGSERRRITSWGGPWPLDERWWEPQRHRRQARVQIVTEDQQALLVVAEQQRWWVAARYD